MPMSYVFAWTDSTIVLNWLSGSPRRFKTYVGNRVSDIIKQIPPDRWHHVLGAETVHLEEYFLRSYWSMSSGGMGPPG